MIPPTHIATPEVWIENRCTYKQQEDCLCFVCDFDNDDNDDDDDDDDDDNDDIPTIIPTTIVADLLLILINQISPIPSPPPPLPSPPSPFNLSYIKVTPPQTTTDPSTDSDTVTPSSSALVIKTIPCYNSGTVILSTSSLERITLYSLLSPHLLIPSQFIRLSYGKDHYCTVIKTFTPPLQATPSSSLSSKDGNN